MKLARKLKRLRVIIALAMLAAFVPSVVEATQVDPSIIARFKKLGAFQKRLAALRSRLLIERGRRLFMTETFNGNGRTCATCHPPSNNFTIDPAFIARLPDDDPLFVAEFNPDLADLENPDLLRRFGLILENLDGFEADGVFRGVPHTLGMAMSMTVNPAGDPALTRPDGSTVANATGWSGDGAPGDGSLRSFAIGAIVQHLPKTTNRVAGKDFRLPTESELDALEAFQLSLGRQAEIDLALMTFADPDVQAGKHLFNGVGINRGCNFCHSNAGANSAGNNRNFNTNTEKLTPAGRPPDGGFGPDATVGAGLGNQTFNATSLIEAADTGPFFHNNSARTIEDAVRFYTTTTFSPDNPFQLSGAQVNQVAAFLRALNALENIRSSNALAQEAQRQPLQARQTIRERVLPDTEDAIAVLTSGPLQLYPDAVALLDEALDLETDARDTLRLTFRNALLRQAIALKNEARGMILSD
jgi:cytochrome c peroxidase